MSNQLSLQAGRVTVFQDVDDTTAFTVEVTDGGVPVDLSGSTWDDPDGLMTVDDTDAASGKLGLSCGSQTQGPHDWRLQADGDTTWLDGVLFVGSTRRVGGTSGTVQVAVENATVTVSAVVATHDHSGAYLPSWGLSSGFMYGTTGTSISTFAFIEDLVTWSPVIVPRPESFDALVAEVTSAGEAGSVLRLGIYEDSDGVPGALVVDAGTVAADTIGEKPAPISQTLPPGQYWVAAVAQLCPNTQPTCTVNGGGDVIPVLGARQDTVAGGRTGYIRPSQSGALPDPAAPTNEATRSYRVMLQVA